MHKLPRECFKNHNLIRFIEQVNLFGLGMVVIGKNGQAAAATSTNGANHKIPG